MYSTANFFNLLITWGLVICSGVFISFLYLQKPADKVILSEVNEEKLVETKPLAKPPAEFPNKSIASVPNSTTKVSSVPTKITSDTLKTENQKVSTQTATKIVNEQFQNRRPGFDKESKASQPKASNTVDQIKQATEAPNPVSVVTAADVLEEPVRMPGIKMEDPTPATRMPGFRADKWKMPFRSGVVIQMHQGYNGQFSHQGKYALDFPHPDGIEILAARAGTIISIANGGKWDGWCRSLKECNSKGQISAGNNITVQHSDGTKARYLHFRPGTISGNLRVGSWVNQGDFLGIMGSTGYTCLTPACTEPDNHLHFEVQNNNGVTIPTPFMECINRANVCDSNGWLVQYSYYTSD